MMKFGVKSGAILLVPTAQIIYVDVDGVTPMTYEITGRKGVFIARCCAAHSHTNQS